MKLRIKKLHPEAKLPSFAHATDAGMDVYTVEDVCVQPGDHEAFIKTGIAVAVPDGYVALAWDKSGVANKRLLKVTGGVFDAGYRGEYLVGLYNFGTETQCFKAGDKIAQILIQKIEHPEIVEVDELDDTDRGEGGFGSTGV